MAWHIQVFMYIHWNRKMKFKKKEPWEIYVDVASGAIPPPFPERGVGLRETERDRERERERFLNW